MSTIDFTLEDIKGAILPEVRTIVRTEIKQELEPLRSDIGALKQDVGVLK